LQRKQKALPTTNVTECTIDLTTSEHQRQHPATASISRNAPRDDPDIVDLWTDEVFDDMEWRIHGQAFRSLGLGPGRKIQMDTDTDGGTELGDHVCFVASIVLPLSDILQLASS